MAVTEEFSTFIYLSAAHGRQVVGLSNNVPLCAARVATDLNVKIVREYMRVAYAKHRGPKRLIDSDSTNGLVEKLIAEEL